MKNNIFDQFQLRVQLNKIKTYIEEIMKKKEIKKPGTKMKHS